MDGNGGMNFDPMTGQPLNAEPAPQMNFDPMTGQPLNNVAPAPQPVYTQPAPQPVYVQPVYTQPVYTQPVQNVAEVKYPGKEIIGLVFGIFALIHGLIGLYTIVPVYGWIAGGINAVMAIIFAIVAKSMWGTIKKNATSYSGKIKAGNGMATAGLILAIIGIVGAIIIAVIAIIIVAVGGGASFLTQYLNNMP